MTDPSEWATRKDLARLEENCQQCDKKMHLVRLTTGEVRTLRRMALYAIEAKEREAKPCGKCNGSGYVDAPCPDGRRGCLVDHADKCPACNGTGRQHSE